MKGFLAAVKQRYATAPVPPEKLPDVALLAQLWADQYQHVATLSVVGQTSVVDDATQRNPPGERAYAGK